GRRQRLLLDREAEPLHQERRRSGQLLGQPRAGRRGGGLDVRDRHGRKSSAPKRWSAITLKSSTVREANYVNIGTTKERRWSALALVVTAQFMVILDVAIVNVALPSIKSDLHFSATNLQWVISAYAILFGGALLLGGRLADLLGRRRLFMSGLGLFAASSLLCGIAWSEASLIAFPAVQ